MIELIDKETGKSVGQISDEDLRFLIDSLEEESLDDQDYYFDNDVIEFLKEEGLPQQVEASLRAALGGRDGVEIIFKRK